MQNMKKQIRNKITCDYAIIGSGNIALRHVENIKSITPSHKICLCKRTNSRYDKKIKDICDTSTNILDDIIPMNHNSIAIIASPASYHIEDAVLLIKKGFNLLIEKPLTDNTNKIKKIYRTLKNKKNIILVGYNLRYSDLLQKSKKIIDGKTLGEISSVNINVQTNYKKWRPVTKHKQSVTASKMLGGGVLLELSHEIDYMHYLFDVPTNVSSISYTSPNSKIETSISSLFLYENKDLIISLNQDICSNIESRFCDIYCTNGKIRIDLNLGTICITKNNNKKIIKHKLSNNMYMKEIRNLIYSIKKSIKPLSNLETASITQNIIKSIETSINVKGQASI